MRLGVTFAELVTDLRTELGRSEDLAHGVGDLAILKRKINSVYEMLYDDYKWPHLRRTFDRIAMVAGERYYDLPANLDPEYIESARVLHGSTVYPFEVGIGDREYAQYDSVLDERSDPPLRYEIRYPTAPQPSTMFEVWPVPASAESGVEFTGIYKPPPLVNDADICLLDAEAVILSAAAKLADGDDKDSATSDANYRLRQARGGNPGSARVRLGLGDADRTPVGRAIVRVS